MAVTLLLIIGFLFIVGCVSTVVHLRLDARPKILDGAEEAPEDPAPTPALEDPAPVRPPPRQLTVDDFLVVTSPHLVLRGNPLPQGSVIARTPEGQWRYQDQNLSAASVDEMVRQRYLTQLSESVQALGLNVMNDLNDSVSRFLRRDTSFEALNRDFARIAADFNRVFPTASRVQPSSPDAGPVAAKPTPKSALDRLLEDDDPVLERDSGVKPGS